MEPTQLADLLTRSARRIRHGQSDALAPLGLNPSQARALRVVLRADEPLRMSDLADKLGIVPRSATTIVDALEAAGLVARHVDPANRRSTLLRPTPKALEVGEALRTARRESAEVLFARLDEAQRAELGELLTLLTEDH